MWILIYLSAFSICMYFYNKEIKSIFIRHRHLAPFIVFDIHLLADERTTATVSSLAFAVILARKACTAAAAACAGHCMPSNLSVFCGFLISEKDVLIARDALAISVDAVLMTIAEFVVWRHTCTCNWRYIFGERSSSDIGFLLFMSVIIIIKQLPVCNCRSENHAVIFAYYQSFPVLKYVLNFPARSSKSLIKLSERHIYLT